MYYFYLPHCVWSLYAWAFGWVAWKNIYVCGTVWEGTEQCPKQQVLVAGTFWSEILMLCFVRYIMCAYSITLVCADVPFLHIPWFGESLDFYLCNAKALATGCRSHHLLSLKWCFKSFSGFQGAFGLLWLCACRWYSSSVCSVNCPSFTRCFCVPVGIQSFCRDLVEVADILEKTAESAAEEAEPSNPNPTLKKIYEGLSLIEAKLQRVFAKHGLQKMNPVGGKYDPYDHEIVCHVPAEGMQPGTIALVTQDGYKLHGRTIRHALVGVAVESQEWRGLLPTGVWDLTELRPPQLSTTAAAACLYLFIKLGLYCMLASLLCVRSFCHKF